MPESQEPAEPAEAAPPTRLYRILSRWTDAVKFELECASLRVCLEAAVSRGANLEDADLTGADLRGADLDGANLTGANLTGANLTGANLTGANLTAADLTGANLTAADLDGANLTGANLTGANLTAADLDGADLDGANLTAADLDGANLRGANLRGADLRPIRADLYDVFVTARAEAPGFLLALREGRVNGSCYRGECACLVGTIANVRGVNPDTLYQDPSRPIERFLYNVKQGDTPETNEAAKLVAEWTQAFIGEEV